MGIWIELRCENRSNPSAEGIAGSRRCCSHDNAGPMEMASDTRASVVETLREIEANARATGWEKTKYGWICPHCCAQPTVRSDLAAETAEHG